MWNEIKQSLEEQMLLLSKRLQAEEDPLGCLHIVEAIQILDHIIYP